MLQTALRRPPVPVVVRQHAEESALLRHVRSGLVRSPHVQLRRLQRLDDRIAAHLDGLSVAGAYGTRLCMEALERPGTGEVFAAASRALQEHDGGALERLVDLSGALPEARRGLLSALAWASPVDLRGIVQSLLSSADAFRRELALSACRLHRIDPGPALLRAMEEADTSLRASAFRAAGELGRTALLGRLLHHVTEGDPNCAFQAAAASVLLGDRSRAIQALESFSKGDDPHCWLSTHLVVLSSPFDRACECLAGIASERAPGAPLKRQVIRAAGQVGDIRCVPWLMSLMDDDACARLAGESFTLITGADLAALDLERKPPGGVAAGPTESAEDDDVALDEDESLPWPDQRLVQQWWQAHAAQMPAGARCFMGAEPSREHCLRVLREGGQRQRFAAAWHLAMLRPGEPLFPVCAPAWRQQRLLSV